MNVEVLPLDFAGLGNFLPWGIMGYLFGSCPTGFILVKLIKGEDIRDFGSGNIGATNVSRVLGRGWAVFTAVADMLKGGAAMLVAMLAGQGDPALLSLVGACGVVGHNYPVWIGFKGGKGVATSFGVIACFDFFNPIPAIMGGIVWFAAREISLMVSVASLVSLAASAAFVLAMLPRLEYFACAVFLFALSAWRHRENITRIAAGSENKVNPLYPRVGERAGKPPRAS
jgi:glycerol-3-phosphate acyltransferase PlsY